MEPIFTEELAVHDRAHSPSDLYFQTIVPVLTLFVSGSIVCASGVKLRAKDNWEASHGLQNRPSVVIVMVLPFHLNLISLPLRIYLVL